jgi:magnesium transporter
MPSPRDGLLWVDGEAVTEAELSMLTTTFGIHALAVEDIRTAGQRTKLDAYDGHHHIALRDCELRADRLVAREIDVLVGPGWLLTVRHSAHGSHPASLEPARRLFELQLDERGRADEGFALWAVLDVVVDRYFAVTDAIDSRLDTVEDIVFDERVRSTPREIFELRRAIVTFRRAIAPLRDVLSALLRKEVPCVSGEALVHLQDVLDHVLRSLDVVESQRELLTGLLEGQLAVQSNQMSRVMKATSSWGAILIAATLIAGIYGMNFEHMPELGWQLGYPFALGTMLVVTIGLYVVFKRRGWL